jgi:hypothetical protein
MRAAPGARLAAAVTSSVRALLIVCFAIRKSEVPVTISDQLGTKYSSEPDNFRRKINVVQEVLQVEISGFGKTATTIAAALASLKFGKFLHHVKKVKGFFLLNYASFIVSAKICLPKDVSSI